MLKSAQQDFTQATKLARSMVCQWGMSDALGNVAYDESGDNGNGFPGFPYHEKSYSEQTAKAIDDEVRKLLEEAHNRAKEILITHKEAIEKMTQMLMEYETLDAQDIRDILNHEWDDEKKKKRLREADNLFKCAPSGPPPPPKFPTDTDQQSRPDDPGLGVAET